MSHRAILNRILNPAVVTWNARLAALRLILTRIDDASETAWRLRMRVRILTYLLSRHAHVSEWHWPRWDMIDPPPPVMNTSLNRNGPPPRSAERMRSTLRRIHDANSDRYTAFYKSLPQAPDEEQAAFARLIRNQHLTARQIACRLSQSPASDATPPCPPPDAD